MVLLVLMEKFAIFFMNKNENTEIKNMVGIKVIA